MYIIRGQRDAATLLVTLCLAALESVRNDLLVSPATANERNSTVVDLRARTSQLRGKVSRLTLEVSSPQALRHGCDLSQKCLADPSTKVDRLCKVLTWILDLMDGDLGVPDGQS